MDIVVTGHHTHVSDRFRAHVEEKLAKVTQLSPRMRRIDVMVSQEPNRRQSKATERIEITCRDKGPVIRAEAAMEDKYAALDVAIDKLMERLRRAHDRRTVHRGRHTPDPMAHAAAAPDAPADETTDETEEPGVFGAVGDSPVEVREKVHTSRPMTLEDAVREMELVGHDFFLFHDSETDKASVVYRRRGWSYGVIHLDLDSAPEADATAS